MPEDKQDNGSEDGSERRSAPRIPFEVWVEERSEDSIYFQRTADVGPGGLHLAGTIPHPEGTEVVVRFGLPDGGDDIEARGVVAAGTREEGGTGMGIRFVDLAPEIQQRIEWFIKKFE